MIMYSVIITMKYINADRTVQTKNFRTIVGLRLTLGVYMPVVIAIVIIHLFHIRVFDYGSQSINNIIMFIYVTFLPGAVAGGP